MQVAITGSQSIVASGHTQPSAAKAVKINERAVTGVLIVAALFGPALYLRASETPGWFARLGLLATLAVSAACFTAFWALCAKLDEPIVFRHQVGPWKYVGIGLVTAAVSAGLSLAANQVGVHSTTVAMGVTAAVLFVSSIVVQRRDGTAAMPFRVLSMLFAVGALVVALASERAAVLGMQVTAVVLAAIALAWRLRPLVKGLELALNAIHRVIGFIHPPLKWFFDRCMYPMQRTIGVGWGFGHGSLPPVACRCDETGSVRLVQPKRGLPRRVVEPKDGSLPSATRVENSIWNRLPVVRPYSDSHMVKRLGVGVTVFDLTPLIFNTLLLWALAH